MTFITRAASAIAFSATLFASTAAFALTPAQVASQAYRGEIDGISSYQALQNGVRSGRISGEDILEAAGAEVNSVDANLVESFLRSNDD